MPRRDFRVPAPGRASRWYWAAGLAVAIALVRSSALAGPAETRARQGVEHYRNQNYEASVEAFRKAAELKPDSAAIQHDLGTALARKGRYEEAGEALARSLNLSDHPARGESFYNLGWARVRAAEGGPESPPDPNAQLRALKSGLEAFRQAILENPADRDAKYNYETTKFMIRRIEEQMRHQEKSESGDGEDGDEQQDRKQNQQGEKNQDDPSGQKRSSGDQDQESQSDSDSESQEDRGDEKNRPNQNSREKSASEEDQEESRKEQEQGLERNATPTPKPGENQRQDRDREDESGEDGRESPAASSSPASNPRSGQGAQAESTPALTPEQLDALRVLNSLAQEKPEQFQRLFRFQGRGAGKRPSKDW
jgi:Ca-activated chloride channel family protein